METIFLLNYGNDLDHDKMNLLIKEKLMPFRKLYNNKINKNIVNAPDIELIIDTFDFNKDKHVENQYYLEYFYLSRNQFESFYKKFTRLKGHHVRCKPNHRGHYYASINDKEYTARVFVTLDDTQLIFVDDESIDNEELRRKVYKLPSNLQSLVISKRTIRDHNERERYVKEWINKILLINIEKI